jgi:DNA-directed RNA polymerase specialized sigma subunit
MDKKIFNEDGSITTVGDIMEEKEHVEVWGQFTDHAKINELLNSDLLSEVEKLAITCRFVHDMKFREIDEIVQKHLGNPKSKGFYFINTGLEKLRNALIA